MNSLHHIFPQKSNLGIRYGSMSGNLKPWPVQGSPPKQPLSFREPVPQGLIESIGQTVQHWDTFGVKPQQSPNVYLPPPPQQIQAPSQHFDVNSVSIAHDCNRGGQLSYDGAASTQDFIQAHNAKLETPESSYGPPPTGHVAATNVVNHQVLPGLDSLNVISAQRSHSIDIPQHGGHGNTYDIQFQKSIAQDSGPGQHSTHHDQLINDSLLQSIISAVEQNPAQANDHQAHPSENSEVKIAFKNQQEQPAEGETAVEETSKEE